MARFFVGRLVERQSNPTDAMSQRFDCLLACFSVSLGPSEGFLPAQNGTDHESLVQTMNHMWELRAD